MVCSKLVFLNFPQCAFCKPLYIVKNHYFLTVSQGLSHSMWEYKDIEKCLQDMWIMIESSKNLSQTFRHGYKIPETAFESVMGIDCIINWMYPVFKKVLYFWYIQKELILNTGNLFIAVMTLL